MRQVFPGYTIHYKDIYKIQEKPHAGWIANYENQFSRSLRKKKNR